MYRTDYSDEEKVLMSSPAYRSMVAAREDLIKEQVRGKLIKWENSLKRIQRFKARNEETYLIISAVRAFVEEVESACGIGYIEVAAEKIKEKCFSLANDYGYSGSKFDLEGQVDFLLHRGLLSRILSYCEELEDVVMSC